jgi:hypothetical protein
MSDQDKQCWPAAKIQRRLRADEALIEIVRAERVFLASRKDVSGKHHPTGEPNEHHPETCDAWSGGNS